MPSTTVKNEERPCSPEGGDASHARVLEAVRNCGPVERLLDLGCGDGQLTRRIATEAANVRMVVAGDLSLDRLEAARRNAPSALLVHLPAGPAPFRDGAFDVICLLDVLEHVADEKVLLADIWRLLGPGGRLILTTPYAGLFTWADPGNLKFRFPRLHRWHHLRTDPDYYRRRFVDSRKEGLFGDVSLDSMWHKHYTLQQIRDLLEPGFSLVYARRHALFMPVLIDLNIAWRALTGRYSAVLQQGVQLDQVLSAGPLSYLMMICARKKT
jgi:SAM-dependent methyltransferase